jgi:hypothetical protein
VWRVLERLDINRLPASQRYKRRTQRWKRYEKQRPDHQLQIDVKFIEPITSAPARRKRYYQYTAIDDCTRLRVLRIHPRSDQKTAMADTEGQRQVERSHRIAAEEFYRRRRRSSTTPACSTTNCARGRTNTTTADPWRP